MGKIDPADKDWEDAGKYVKSNVSVEAVDPRVRMLWERWEMLCWECGNKTGTVVVLNKIVRIHEIWCERCAEVYAK